MMTVRRLFAAGEDIPVLPMLWRRKLFKYYSRESMAAVFCALRLAGECDIPRSVPFYYSGSVLGTFDFDGVRAGESVHKILSGLPPVSSFHLMRNMAPAFVSMELGLKGDDAVVIDSAQALLYAAVTAPGDSLVLIGAASVGEDGRVEAGFSLGSREEFRSHPLFGRDLPALDLFRPWE